LSERAARARTRGDGGDALRLYTEAVRMDPSYGPAYLGLGELRAALGDAGEAERVYALALRLPTASADAYAARALLRYGRGDVDGAVTDMEASLARAPAVAQRLLRLAGWHVARQGWAAALVSWRRLLVLYEHTDQDSAADHARTQVRALTVLAAESDPVHGIGGAHPSWVRRALASIAVRLPASD
jgi:tetratricopeptide (TPR) repeat protein